MKPFNWDASASAKAGVALQRTLSSHSTFAAIPSRHFAMNPTLVAAGARNLEGAEGGFVYTKVPVTLDAKDIEQTANEVRRLASEYGLETDIIDRDWSDDTQKAKLYLLEWGLNVGV